MEDLYAETIYRIPEPPVLVIRQPMSELSEEGRKTIQNLCTVLRTKPAPRVVVCTEEDLTSGLLRGQKLIAFGHHIPGLTTETLVDYQGGGVILTEDPATLSGDAERKKRLWAALQPWLQTL